MKKPKNESQLSGGADAAYLAKLHELQLAYDAFNRSPWHLGDLILAVQAEHRTTFGDKITDHAIGLLLTPKLSGQRIGQIRNTAKFFTPEFRDVQAEFRVYELARIANDKRTNDLTVAQVLEVIRANPSTEAIEEALVEEIHYLHARVTMTKVGDGWQPSVEFKFDKADAYVRAEQWPELALDALRARAGAHVRESNQGETKSVEDEKIPF